jgi:hypothetical protein
MTALTTGSSKRPGDADRRDANTSPMTPSAIKYAPTNNTRIDSVSVGQISANIPSAAASTPRRMKIHQI